MSKLPSFQFYPGDWMKDPNVRRCSLAARGVWMDILCLMFECEDRGVLASGDKPWSDQEVAGAVSGPTDVVLSCIAELELKGVVSRNQSGAMFSRRLVRDEQVRKGNRERQDRFRNGGVTVPVTERSQRSSSSSSASTSDSKQKANLGPQTPRPDLRSSVRQLAKAKTLTPTQERYGEVGVLINGAVGIVHKAISAGKSPHSADCKEELKEYAARHSLPCDPKAIYTALDIAEQRVKPHMVAS